MSRQYHELKTETEYYQAIENGLKTFELRKNDRDFKVGDMLTLEETVQGIKTGRKIWGKEIIYIFFGGKYGLEEGYRNNATQITINQNFKKRNLKNRV